MYINSIPPKVHVCKFVKTLQDRRQKKQYTTLQYSSLHRASMCVCVCICWCQSSLWESRSRMAWGKKLFTQSVCKGLNAVLPFSLLRVCIRGAMESFKICRAYLRFYESRFIMHNAQVWNKMWNMNNICFLCSGKQTTDSPELRTSSPVVGRSVWFIEVPWHWYF